jgi:hypothetical protein
MSTHTIDAGPRRAATVVGVAYLFAMAAAMFTEGYVRGTLIVAGDATVTARNIAEHTLLFRASLVLELLTFISDTALITALFVILEPVSRPLALFAAATRYVAVAVCVTMVTHGFDVLRVLGGGEYLGAFTPEQLAALARLASGIHGATYNVAFVLLGLGSTVFAVLWLRSGLVPRALAVLGIIASPMLAGGAVLSMLSPTTYARLNMLHMAPMFFFEVGMGLYLLIHGLRPPNGLRHLPTTD